MIDLHCHLLPCIDDGPTTLADALDLARALVADGVRHAVATPHVYPGRWDNRRSGIRAEYTRFARVLALQKIPLGLSFAGEVRLTPEALDLLAEGELPLLGGDAAHAGQCMKALLLEMPDGQVPLGADRFCDILARQGIVPLIAHPERNRGVMENPDRLRPLIDAGAQVQLTAGALIGEFGPRAQATAQTLLERGWAHAVASDAHNLKGRAPRLTAAYQWLAKHHGESTARQLTQTSPARLCGLPPEAPAASPAPVAQAA